MPTHPPAVPRPAVGRLLVLAAVLLWSTSGLFARSGAFDVWPEGERGALLAFWRALFAGGLLVPFVRRPRLSRAMLPMTASFALMNATYLSALTLTSAANAIWLQSMAPLWVFAVGVMVLGEPFHRRDLLPLLCGLAGIGVILFFEIGQATRSDSNGSPPWGIVLGLVAGVSYAGVVLSLRRLRTEDSAWLVALNHLVAAAAMLPYVLYLDRWPTLAQLPVLAAFGVVQMGLPYVLFARSLRHITSQEATLIGLLEPLLMPLWVLLFVGERPAPWTLAGGGLILAGLVVRYARRSVPPEAAPESA